MKRYKKNKVLLENTHNYKSEMEHDACGVGLIASTNGKKSRKIVEYGIEALKAIWHRGAVDADGKSGDGAGWSHLNFSRIASHRIASQPLLSNVDKVDRKSVGIA